MRHSFNIGDMIRCINSEMHMSRQQGKVEVNGIYTIYKFEMDNRVVIYNDKGESQGCWYSKRFVLYQESVFSDDLFTL